MSAKFIKEKFLFRIKASQLKEGQLAIIDDLTFTSYNGEIVLRNYHGMVSLSTPGRTWDKESIIMVRPLPPGTVVEITSEA